MKILVTGNAGSGKSTTARLLAEKYSIEYFSLDRIVWQEYWRKTPIHERKKAIENLIAKTSWVIDGVEDEILNAADSIIFLDVPRRICFYRAFKRNLPYLFTPRPELPAHCPEILIVPQLIKIIWNFPKRVRPNILAEKTRRKDKSFAHIQTKKQLKAILN